MRDEVAHLCCHIYIILSRPVFSFYLRWNPPIPRQIPFGLNLKISCRSFSLSTINWAICLYLALTQKRSITDMIKVNTANIVNIIINRVSAVAAASICSIGVSAKEIMCNPFMIKLSVITSYPFDFINCVAGLIELVFSPQLLLLHVTLFLSV